MNIRKTWFGNLNFLLGILIVAANSYLVFYVSLINNYISSSYKFSLLNAIEASFFVVLEFCSYLLIKKLVLKSTKDYSTLVRVSRPVSLICFLVVFVTGFILRFTYLQKQILNINMGSDASYSTDLLPEASSGISKICNEIFINRCHMSIIDFSQMNMILSVFCCLLVYLSVKMLWGNIASFGCLFVLMFVSPFYKENVISFTSDYVLLTLASIVVIFSAVLLKIIQKGRISTPIYLLFIPIGILAGFLIGSDVLCLFIFVALFLLTLMSLNKVNISDKSSINNSISYNPLLSCSILTVAALAGYFLFSIIANSVTAGDGINFINDITNLFNKIDISKLSLFSPADNPITAWFVFSLALFGLISYVTTHNDKISVLTLVYICMLFIYSFGSASNAVGSILVAVLGTSCGIGIKDLIFEIESEETVQDEADVLKSNDVNMQNVTVSSENRYDSNKESQSYTNDYYSRNNNNQNENNYNSKETVDNKSVSESYNKSDSVDSASLYIAKESVREIEDTTETLSNNSNEVTYKTDENQSDYSINNTYIAKETVPVSTPVNTEFSEENTVSQSVSGNEIFVQEDKNYENISNDNGFMNDFLGDLYEDEVIDFTMPPTIKKTDNNNNNIQDLTETENITSTSDSADNAIPSTFANDNTTPVSDYKNFENENKIENVNDSVSNTISSQSNSDKQDNDYYNPDLNAFDPAIMAALEKQLDSGKLNLNESKTSSNLIQVITPSEDELSVSDDGWFFNSVPEKDMFADIDRNEIPRRARISHEEETKHSKKTKQKAESKNKVKRNKKIENQSIINEIPASQHTTEIKQSATRYEAENNDKVIENSAKAPVSDNSIVENKPGYIENVLPLPKPHVKKEISFSYEPSEKLMKYDIEISDNDDFDYE